MATNTDSNLEPILRELRKRRGLSEDGLAINPALLQKVRALEEADAQATQHVQLAAARGEDLERLALLDTLTELYNHRSFIKELKAELTRAKRYKHSVAVCMLTVDNLDSIGKQFGNLTADSVLKVVANVLRTSLREIDVPARYGGNQFIFSLSRSTVGGAALVCERVRERIASQVIVYNWQNFSVTASLGAAAYPEQAHNYDELIARAMEAVEQASERGGDRVMCA